MRRALLGLMAAALLWPTPAVADNSDGLPPYGGCDEAAAYPASDGADWCRDHGWWIGKRYVVTPHRTLRYYNLPSCRYEDGSGQRGSCGWNVESADGNGCGEAYLVLHRHGIRQKVTLFYYQGGVLHPMGQPC